MKRLIPILCLLSVCGCGSATYESRLEETVKYFRFEAARNTALGKEWYGGGLKLRPPKQLNQLAAPPALPPGQESPEGQVDLRQPPFVDLELLKLSGLPGLEAAWSVPVDVQTEEGSARLNAYMFVFTNAKIYLDQKPESLIEAEDAPPPVIESPGTFNSELLAYLQDGMRAEGDPHEYLVDESYPPGTEPTYVQRQRVITYGLEIKHPSFEGGIADLTIYQVQNKTGSIQATILTAIPQGISPGEQLQERFVQMLGTVQLDEQPPKPQQAGPGGVPAGPSLGL